MKYVELKGIITPILTPMDSDESAHLDELRSQIDRLLEGGVRGLFPFGTNNEGYILNENKKVEVLEATIGQARGRIPVYVGSGYISTTDTIRTSKKAQELSTDMLSIITPSFALASQKELYNHYVGVAKHMDTPVVLYNIPARTGNKLLPETVTKLAKDIDVIMGIRNSNGNWDNLLAYITLTKELDKGFRILSGDSSLTLPRLEVGGADGIAGCANVYPRVLASIYDLFQAGKLGEAEATQSSIASFHTVLEYGNPNAIIKKAVSPLGYPINDCHRPFNYLYDEGIETLKLVLRENADKDMR